MTNIDVVTQDTLLRELYGQKQIRHLALLLSTASYSNCADPQTKIKLLSACTTALQQVANLFSISFGKSSDSCTKFILEILNYHYLNCGHLQQLCTEVALEVFFLNLINRAIHFDPIKLQSLLYENRDLLHRGTQRRKVPES